MRTFLLKFIFLAAVAGTFVALAGGGLIFWHFSRGLPKIITISDYRPPGVTRVFATGSTRPDGTPDEPAEIGEFYKERRYVVPYEKLPQSVVQAFISAEDDQFFEHSGINLLSILRASIANFRAGHVVQGGSTITQQVAKSLLLTSERSLDRKIKEVILSSRIEHNLNKKQILYLYLNQIYLGHGAYGVQAASRTYFHKDVSQLTIAEAALLAGMPQAPGKYSPLLNPKRAKERQLYVLKRMVENRYITQSQMNDAATASLKVYRDDELNARVAPYYVEHVRKYLLEKYGEKALYEEGLTVYVPLSVSASLAATKNLKEGLLAIDKRIGYRGIINHLDDNTQVENFLAAYRLKLIEKKLGYQVLLPEGRIDRIEAIRHAGFVSDLGLLDEGELYQAVITHLDEGKKSAKVMIGAVRADLFLDRAKWARPVKDESYPKPFRDPAKPFQKGDVIWVSVTKQGPSRDPVAALEQVPMIQGAVFSLEAKTGNVIAMVGGYDFSQSEFNRAIQANRQPGSSFKPIIYSAALEKGFTPTSVIVDSPLVFKDSDGSNTWKPNNFDEKFYGDTIFRQALIKSRNIPTVKIVQAVQIPYLVQYAKRLGMTGQFNMDLSISLGSATISLMDLTKVYALFPRLGRKVSPVFMSKIEDRDGRVLEQSAPQPPFDITKVPMASTAVTTQSPDLSTSPATSPMPSGSPSPQPQPTVQYPLADDPAQVLDPRVAYVMSHLMTEVVTFGTGHGAQELGRMAAGKTGTTNDYIDAWFMGFTPQVVTGVWVGFDGLRSIGPAETGAKAALPIWLGYMKEAVKPYPKVEFAVPSGVTFATIDPNTGKLKPSGSAGSIREAFIEGTQPTEAKESGELRESASDFFKEDKE
jgi:penicillin-binding protein 1A